jgi:hypothetical protein
MQTDALNDPARQFTCMGRAAANQLAPGVLYADKTEALAIIDLPDLAGFLTEVDNGRVKLDRYENKLTYGKLLIKTLEADMKTDRFKQATRSLMP